MKFLKGLLTFFLVLIIVGGLGYIGYSVYVGEMFTRMDMTPSAQEEEDKQGDMNMAGMDNSTPALPNPLVAQNREKMNEAITLIDQALALITIDPYSKATIPKDNDEMNMNSMTGQLSQGTGTINIYPSGSSSVNITPSENATEDATEAMSGMTMPNDSTQNNNIVYDQGKLQQLHSGIYTMAQGVLAIKELNEKLLNQSMMIETNPITYQTYVLRYNAALKNKAELESAVESLKQVSILINVNPYASPNGYEYNSNNLMQLHEGIYKLAQGMAILDSLEDDFANQMSQATIQAQNMVYDSSQMDMGQVGLLGSGVFGNVDITTIFKLIIIVLLIGLIAGILGAVLKMFRRNNNRLKVTPDRHDYAPSDKE